MIRLKRRPTGVSGAEQFQGCYEMTYKPEDTNSFPDNSFSGSPEARSRMPRSSDPRSRSPARHSYSHRHRSRSPLSHHKHRHHHSSHHKRKRTPPPDNESYVPSTAVPPRPVILPFSSKPISKHDYPTFKPMFASYLDIQKGLVLEDLDDGEIKGRWKSFVSRWNRGDLAAGWYDPSTLQKATATARSLEEESKHGEPPVLHSNNPPSAHPPEDDSDSDLGPAPPPPGTISNPNPGKHGPTIPTRTDLTLRDEAISDAQQDARVSLTAHRKADRQQQKALIEELDPRAEPGTRERQLEKKVEVAASNREFAAQKEGDGGGEMGEGELMGGDAGVKEMRMKEERKKNEREVRREEVLRARAAEREERVAGLRQREERTMGMLRGLAKERFG